MGQSGEGLPGRVVLPDMQPLFQWFFSQAVGLFQRGDLMIIGEGSAAKRQRRFHRHREPQSPAVKDGSKVERVISGLTGRISDLTCQSREETGWRRCGGSPQGKLEDAAEESQPVSEVIHGNDPGQDHERPPWQRAGKRQ